VEADAALVRAARAVVLHAEAGEDVDLVVAEADRDLDLHLAVRGLQDGREVLGDLQPLDGLLEVVADDLVVGDLRMRGSVGDVRGARRLVAIAVRVLVQLPLGVRRVVRGAGLLLGRPGLVGHR
jgi:hypothetical protein